MLKWALSKKRKALGEGHRYYQSPHQKIWSISTGHESSTVATDTPDFHDECLWHLLINRQRMDSSDSLIQMTSTICDYSNYDYKKEFWANNHREYEHTIESKTIDALLHKYGKDTHTLLDAGCGFGRLYPAYDKHCHHAILVDYAENLLNQAKGTIQSNKVTFLKQSLYELDLDETVDVILSIRTLHHLNDVTQLFNQFNQALSLHGKLILDIPNKLHLKNRWHHFLRGSRHRLFNESDHKLSDNFYNYHPKRMINELDRHGFTVIDIVNVGLFRVKWMKRLIPMNALIWIESMLTKWIKWTQIAPSIYIVAEKCVDNYVDKPTIEC